MNISRWKNKLLGLLSFVLILTSSFCFFIGSKNCSYQLVLQIKSRGWWEESNANYQLTFSKKEIKNLQWKDEFEFVYQDEYYDVIEKTDSCGFTLYKVHKDHHDTRWSNLKKQAEQSKKENKNEKNAPFYWICDSKFDWTFTLEKMLFRSGIFPSDEHKTAWVLFQNSPPPEA